MAERRTYNLAYGKRYISSDRSEKKVWIQIGKMFIEPESEYGERISIRIDAIPTDPNFTGLINAFAIDPSKNGNSGAEKDLNEIPF